MRDEERRVVWLRNGEDGRHLSAYVDDTEALHIDGHDLGGDTHLISPTGEYEWFQAIPAQHVGDVLELLGAAPGEDVLDVLERDWSGLDRSAAFEKRLRESDIPVERFVR